MDAAEFQRILEIGLGRAILYLKTHDSKPYRENILYACTHNTVYDTQIEGRHYDYLRDVLQSTGELEYYRNPILKDLMASPADDQNKDTWQLFDLAQFFAEQGNQKARQAIFDKFISNVSQGALHGADEIIELDGLKGFLFVADKIQVSENDAWYYYNRLIENLEEEYGKDIVWQAIYRASIESDTIKAYAKAIVEYRKEEDARKSRELSKLLRGHYDEIKKLLKVADWQKAHQFSIWSRDAANNDDLEQAAKDLIDIPENDFESLLTYLQIFKFRPFPFAPDKLINLALSKTSAPTWEGGQLSKLDRVVRAALIALANISHPHVRELALNMIDTSNRIGWAVGLLPNNYQKGDWQYLEPMTVREIDSFAYHGLGIGIRKLFEAHPSKDAVNTLINLYNKGPCSFCRFHWVEFLHSLDTLPNWMIEECKYDSNLDIRNWVMNGFKHLDKE